MSIFSSLFHKQLSAQSHAQSHAPSHAQSPTNSKNRLQEFCQQNKLNLPLYDVYNNDDVNSGCTFHCKVSIVYENNVFAAIGHGLKVKEAEKAAAQALLDQLELHQASQIQVVNRKDFDGTASANGYTSIYIDMENINVNDLRTLFKYYRFNPDHYCFKGFLSVGHHYSETEFIFDGISFEKILVPSTRSDATDIGMIMHAMRLLCAPHTRDDHVTEIVLVSQDRFSCVFAELGEKGFCVVKNNRDIKVTHCSNILQLKALLC